MSLKALAERILQGNQQGNIRETDSFLIPKNRGQKTPQKFPEFPCEENDDPAPDPFALIGETLAEIDRQGRPWTGWRKSLTDDQRQRLKTLEAEIDKAALTGDRQRLETALEAYRDFVLPSRRRMAHE